MPSLLNTTTSLVKRTALLFHLLLPILTISQAAELTLEFENTQIEMGKYITARIVYIGNVEADSADLQQWEDDFFVDRRDMDIEHLHSGKIQTTEHLRLYPRSTGKKVLDTIALGGAFVYPVEITVKPLIRNKTDGSPQWLTHPLTLWQGQTIEVGVKVPLLHPSNQIALGETPFSGFEATAIKPTPRGGKKVKHVIRRWQLTAKNAGEFIIDPPFVEQRGRGRWRFHLPRIKITVQPLPAYLPSTVPVGNISLHTKVDQSTTDSTWQVTIRNNGSLPQEVFGIRAQLAHHARTSVDKVEVLNQEIKTGSQQTYRAYIPDWSLGFAEGPAVSVQYFDIQDGRLRVLNNQLPAIWKIPRWATYLLWGFFIALISIAIFYSIRMIHPWWKHGLLIAQTADPHGLRKILLERHRFHTLDEWACNNGRSGPGIARQLNALCFSPHADVTFEKVKDRVLDIHIRPLWLKVFIKLSAFYRTQHTRRV